MRVLQEVHQGQLVCRHWVDAGGVHAGFLNSLHLALRNQIRPENSWRQLIVQEKCTKNNDQNSPKIAANAKLIGVTCNDVSIIIACLTAVLLFVDKIRSYLASVARIYSS